MPKYDNQADDPQTTARKARQDPLTERHLRQFLSLESCNAANPAYRRGYDLAFGEKQVIAPVRCKLDGYVATTLQELEWHEDHTYHDPDHDFEPYVEEQKLPEARIYCTHCGGRHMDTGEWRHRRHHTHRCEYCRQDFEGPEAVGV